MKSALNATTCDSERSRMSVVRFLRGVWYAGIGENVEFHGVAVNAGKKQPVKHVSLTGWRQ